MHIYLVLTSFYGYSWLICAAVHIKHEMSGGHLGVETTRKQIVLGRDDQAEMTGAAVGFYTG